MVTRKFRELDENDIVKIADTYHNFQNNENYEDDLIKSVTGADCLVIVTEWPEFKEVDLTKIKSLMKKANVVDGRNIFNVKVALY